MGKKILGLAPRMHANVIGRGQNKLIGKIAGSELARSNVPIEMQHELLFNEKS